MKIFFKRVLMWHIAVALLVPTWVMTGISKAERARAAEPTTIAAWTFEDQDTIADDGTSENKGIMEISLNDSRTLSYAEGSGGSGSKAISASDWVDGADTKYWQVEIDTVGYELLKLSSKQRSSSTGPKDFLVQYRIGIIGDWENAGGLNIAVDSTFTTGVLDNLLLPVETDDQSSVYLRWLMATNTSVGGATIASSGTSRIDDIIITGEAIPDPLRPTAPALIPVASPTNDNTPTLNWNAVTSYPPVEKYEVVINDLVVGEIDAPATSYTPADELTDGSYTWKVAAYNSEGWGDYSDEGVFEIDTIVPDIPTVSPVASPVNAASQTITGTAEADSLVKVAGGVSIVSQQLADGTTDFSVSVPLIQDAVNNLVITAADAAGNESGSVGVQIIENSHIDVASGQLQIDATSGLGDLIVNVPVNAEGVRLNLSGLLTSTTEAAKSITTEGKIIINSDTAKGKIKIEIPAGTVITGPADWDGAINAPKIVSNIAGVEPVVEQDVEAKDVLVWEIGAGDKKLIFANPVKLTFFGQAGKLIGYVEGGVFKTIETICNNLAVPTNVGEAECKGDYEDEDLIVWTKHFTSFITYTTAVVPIAAPEFTVESVILNNDNFIKVEWRGVGGGVERYFIVINGVISGVVDVIDDDLNILYAREIEVNNYGKYEVIVYAARNNILSGSQAKTIEIVAPAVTVAPAPVSQPPVAVAPVWKPSVAPERAQAQEPAVEEAAPPDDQDEQEAADENGVIKGDDQQKQEGVNWTPWIVLFILIILAGAATGAYFYWFGEEEQAPAVSTKERIVKKEMPKERPGKKASAKRPKRW